MKKTFSLAGAGLLIALVSVLFLPGCEDDAPEPYDHTKRVLIIGIDGVRSDMITEEFAPNLYAFSQRPGTWFNPQHKTEDITWSGTNWSSICTGVHLEKHGVRDNFFVGSNLKDYPHFFKYINQADPADEVNLLSIAHWSPINYVITERNADYTSIGDIADITVRNVAQRILTENRPLDPDVLFLHFDDVDHAGHFNQFGPQDPEYRNQMKRIDGYVGEVIATLEARAAANGEEWLTIVVSDHGGLGNDHGQGAGVPEVGNTIFFINHPAINAVYSPQGSRMVDVAPTVLQYLGFYTDAARAKMDGEPLAFY